MIIRAKRAPNDFFLGHKYPMEDPSISWAAKGVLAYLMTKPDNWECRNYDLERRATNGIDSVKSIMAELKQAGYISRKIESAGKGKIRWVTEVYELPELNPDFTKAGFTTDEKSTDEKSTDELTTDVKPTGSNNKYSKNKPSQNNSNKTQASQGRAAAAAIPKELKRLFDSVGISRKKQAELIACHWIDEEYVSAHIALAEREKVSTGLLITRMMDGDPLPPASKGNQIPDEYRDIIKR